MPIENESFKKIDGDWTVRVQPSLSTLPLSTIIFLHGWTGDENSMGIFSRGLESSWKFFPRAPVHLEEGYAWVDIQSIKSTRLLDFWPVAQILFGGISSWIKDYQLNRLPVYLVGFSQGAAMALILALRYPLFQRTAILSGFLPVGAEDFLTENSLSGKDFFIAHGKFDDVVPVDLAKKTYQVLENTGAGVDYCEANVGHKLSKICFDKLRGFLTR